MKRYENKGSLLINKLRSQYRTTTDYFFPLPYFLDEEKFCSVFPPLVQFTGRYDVYKNPLTNFNMLNCLESVLKDLTTVREYCHTFSQPLQVASSPSKETVRPVIRVH